MLRISAKGVFLNIQISDGPFQLGQKQRRGGKHSLKLGTAANLKLQHIRQIIRKPLDHAKHIDYFAIYIINRFTFWLLGATEEHSAHAHKRFTIYIVRYLFNNRNYSLGQQPLAAQIRRNRLCRFDLFKINNILC